MAEERAPDDGSNGNGAENPDAAAASGQAPGETAESPTFRERVSRRRRGPEAPEEEAETQRERETPLMPEVAGEPLTCAICNKPIEGEYLQAAYGPVHVGDCSHQTKRVA